MTRIREETWTPADADRLPDPDPDLSRSRAGGVRSGSEGLRLEQTSAA